MSLLDDRRLRAHLERRGETVDVPPDLSEAIHAATRLTSQQRTWLPTRGWSRPRLTVVLTAVAVLAIVGFAGVRVLPPGAGPEGSLAPVERYTAVEIVGLLNEPGLADRIVVVDTDVELAAIACLANVAPPRDCPIGFLVGTGGLMVLPDQAPVYEPDEVVPVPPPGERIEGPLAVRLRGDGAVELVGPLETLLGYQVVWPLESMFAEIERRSESMSRLLVVGPDGVLAGPTFLVDAWLVEVAVPPSCPGMAVESFAPAVLPFACGSVAWLTPAEVQPNVIEQHANSTGISARTPTGGLRVQNSAYGAFAPDPVREGPWSVPQPRRAFYLVRPILAFPEEDCFACSETREAYLVGRIDPLDPYGTQATPSD